MLRQLGVAVLVSAAAALGARSEICIVKPGPNGTDSAPAIVEAFQRCGHNDEYNRGKVVFMNETYTVRSVMNTTGLNNVDIDLQGTLLWDQNIQYWLHHSLPVGYQNQSSAWLFGGSNISWVGHGYGTFDGNGQVWYDFVNGTNNCMPYFCSYVIPNSLATIISNQATDPGRPHQITITGTHNSYFRGLRFVQSQMWTMTVIHSSNILLESIYVNSTDTKQAVGFGFSSLNTDGADTIYADNITFRGWTVDNGDDSIAMKANSTNILIEDCRFYTGLGIAIGSISQYRDTFEYIENVTARNIEINNMRYGAYIKTWTGIANGYPPNGGGGGIGYAANMQFSNFTIHNATGIFALTQCTHYNDANGDCDTSEFQIQNLKLEDWKGDCTSDVVADLQCSAAAPCTGVEIKGIDIIDTVNNTAPANYLCGSVGEHDGFVCTGEPWEENSR